MAGPSKKVAFISSFKPRKCGIATFTSDLADNVALAAGGRFEPLVVAMRAGGELTYNDPVKFEIRQNVRKDYLCAADYINFSHVDVVSVQHEFGLFGGEGGNYLSLLLKKLKAPIVTTLHTVLEAPEEAYRESLIDLCGLSARVITMNERGVAMLKSIYGVSGEKIELVAHGMRDLPFVDSSYYKHKFGMEGRKTILTFGLLSKNKGIEVMLKALPAVVKADPSILYIILGMTHPQVSKTEGESYRFSLQQLVKELGMQENVIFHNRFVADEELHNFLCAADIYVTPYLSREQLTSGTLSFAVGTGKAVVSTPYWAAEELLADGRGKLVAFNDSDRMAEAIIEILSDDPMFYSLRRRAYEYGRSRTWPQIGEAYWKLFDSPKVTVCKEARAAADVESVAHVELPEPDMDHIRRLTDDTGMFQHAKYVIANRDHGYCTDDNSRALILMGKYHGQYPGPEPLELLTKYLSFVMHSQRDDGTVRNFMNFDRTWVRGEPAHDAFGRVLWAYGTVIAAPSCGEFLSIVKDCFDMSVPLVGRQSPRGMAYSILGMAEYLKQFPGASDMKRQMASAADQLVSQYEESRYPDWQWFEDILVYDNAVLPQALYVAAMTLGNERYLEAAEETGTFLLENTFDGRRFSFIGCKGWYERGKAKAKFDQQPLEAGATVMMLSSAYKATSDKKYLVLQRKAFDWFLGENDLGVALYDFRTGGCYDGLSADGVNLNQGAESTLSFMLALLTMIEDCSASEELTPAEELELTRQLSGASGL